VVATSVGVACAAGASAKSSTVPRAIAAVNHITRASSATSRWMGSSDGGVKPISSPDVHRSATSAATLPRPASTMPSTRSCCTMRQRPAPIDKRMAISRWRADDRASRSPARFAQVISSTIAATAIRISSTGRSTLTPPSGALSSGNTAAR
jgi:hypothetical protein